MTMTRKQHKALARRKAATKARNICQRNMPKAHSFLTLFLNPKKTGYRLYDI